MDNNEYKIITLNKQILPLCHVKENIIEWNEAKFIWLVYNWQLLWLIDYYLIISKMAQFSKIQVYTNIKIKF